jgi:hypothetical protein
MPLRFLTGSIEEQPTANVYSMRPTIRRGPGGAPVPPDAFEIPRVVGRDAFSDPSPNLAERTAPDPDAGSTSPIEPRPRPKLRTVAPRPPEAWKVRT